VSWCAYIRCRSATDHGIENVSLHPMSGPILGGSAALVGVETTILGDYAAPPPGC
jgi:hypothetical protein